MASLPRTLGPAQGPTFFSPPDPPLTYGASTGPVGGTYQNVVLADNPLALWPLTESPGTVTAYDATGHGYNGVYAGIAPGVKQAGAPFPQGNVPVVQWPTSTGGVYLTNSGVVLSNTNGWSLEAWVYFTNLSAEEIFLVIGGQDLYVNSSQINFQIYYSGGSHGLQSPSISQLYTWYHVVGTYDPIAARAYLYVNGVPKLSAAVGASPTLLAANTGAQIGDAVNSTSFGLRGNQAYTAVYNYTLTPAQILNHYNAGVVSGATTPDYLPYSIGPTSGRTFFSAFRPARATLAQTSNLAGSLGLTTSLEPPITNLIGWWKADSLGLTNGASVSSWIDSSPNGATLTAAGSAQPTFNTNVVNGMPAVSFNGTTNVMAASTTMANLTECWIVAYYNLASFPSGGQGYSGAFGGINGINSDIVFTGTTSLTTWFSTGWTSPTFYNDGTATGTYTGPMQTWAIQAITTTGFSNPLTPQMGRDRNITNAGRWWNGYIAEVICYNTALTATQRAQVDTYLSNKYGIAVSDSITPPISFTKAISPAPRMAALSFGGGQPVSVVQSNISTEYSAATGTLTLSPTTPGNTIVVALEMYGYSGSAIPSVTSVTDGTNTYTDASAADAQTTSTDYGMHSAFYYCQGAASATTITVNLNTSSYFYIGAYELTPSVYDQGTGATGTTSSGNQNVNAGTLTPSANGAWCGYIGLEDGAGTDSWTTTGWTTLYHGAAGSGATVVASQLQSTAAPLAFSMPFVSNGDKWTASGVSFIPAGQGNTLSKLIGRALTAVLGFLGNLMTTHSGVTTLIFNAVLSFAGAAAKAIGATKTANLTPGKPIELISLGAASTGGSGASVTPAWGTNSPRSAGNLLICWCDSSGHSTLVTTPTGWTPAVTNSDGTYTFHGDTIFYKIATGGDAAPTLAGITGTNITGQLAEFTPGGAIDQSAGNYSNASSYTVTASTSDIAPGDLVCFVNAISYTSATVMTQDAVTINGAAPAAQTDNHTTSTTGHWAFGYGITTSKGTDAVAQSCVPSVYGQMVAFVSFSVHPQPSAVTKSIGIPETAGLTFSGAISRGVGRSLTAGLNMAGKVGNGVTKNILATLSFVGKTSHGVAKRILAGLSFIGNTSRGIDKTVLTANLSFVGNARKGIAKAILAVLRFIGNVVPVRQHLGGYFWSWLPTPSMDLEEPVPSPATLYDYKYVITPGDPDTLTYQIKQPPPPGP